MHICNVPPPPSSSPLGAQKLAYGQREALVKLNEPCPWSPSPFPTSAQLVERCNLILEPLKLLFLAPYDQGPTLMPGSDRRVPRAKQHIGGFFLLFGCARMYGVVEPVCEFRALGIESTRCN